MKQNLCVVLLMYFFFARNLDLKADKKEFEHSINFAFGF